MDPNRLAMAFAYFDGAERTLCTAYDMLVSADTCAHLAGRPGRRSDDPRMRDIEVADTMLCDAIRAYEDELRGSADGQAA